MKSLVVMLVCLGAVLAQDVEEAGIKWSKLWNSGPYVAFVKSAKDAAGAARHCKSLGGRLALPTNLQEDAALRYHAAGYGGDEWWIGAKAATVSGQRMFVTEDGMPLNYTNWLSGEPNNFLGSSVLGEDCVSMNTKQGGWNDIRCSTLLWYVCEKDQDSQTFKGAMFNYTYFNLAARGEVGRLLFALAGAPYADDRVEFSEWGAMKYTTLWGVLPQLAITENGKTSTYCQSNSINRILADKLGLLGKTPEDAYYIDMIVGCMADVMAPMFTLFSLSGKDGFAAKYNQTSASLPWWLQQTEKFLETNMNGYGWFVGDRPTLADAAVYHAMWLTQKLYRGAIKQYPKLQANLDRFERLPNIATWLVTRPSTPY